VFRELSIEKAVLIGLSMGGIVAQKFALKYGHLLKALVLVDTTAHGIGPDATDDAFLAVADKQGYKKAVQDLSDISFSSSASPALLEWARREVIQTPEFVARAAVRRTYAASRRACSLVRQRHERGSTIVTSNLPFEEWTAVFGSQRLTGALLDRLTHHVHILELNGESYRLKQSKAKRRDPRPADEAIAPLPIQKPPKSR
jgi:pimeloyl-ACP methyl ester carboxylesterase